MIIYLIQILTYNSSVSGMLVHAAADAQVGKPGTPDVGLYLNALNTVGAYPEITNRRVVLPESPLAAAWLSGLIVAVEVRLEAGFERCGG